MKKVVFLLIALCSLQSFSANAQVCDPNMDLELGTLANWGLSIGSCCPIGTFSVTTSPGSHFTITSGSGTDACGGFPIVGNGLHSLQIGNNSGTAGAQKAIFFVHVPASASSYSLVYRLAMVLQDPSHAIADQPHVSIQAFDSGAASPLPLVCANYNYVAGALPGFYTSSCSTTPVFYKPWTTYTLDLNGLSGHTIRIEFATYDCGLGGHFGYAYVDMSCGLFAATITSSCGSSTIQLTAPAGFASYTWYDSTTFTTLYGTTATISIPTPSVLTHYAVVMTPAPGFGCTDTLYTSAYASCSGTPLPGTINTSATTACGTSTVTLTVVGSTGSNLQWQSSPDSLTWTNIISANNATYLASGITTNTYFRCKDSCCSSGLTATTAGVKITYAPCCSGIPTSGTASASTTYCSACVLTLNLSGYSSLAGISFQWQASPDSATWSNIAGATTVPYTFVPTGAYYYRCMVSCSWSGLSAYSNALKVLYQYLIVTDTINSAFSSLCPGPEFYVKVNGTSPLLSLRTYYGDGSNDVVSFTSASTYSYSTHNHAYATSGTYTIKQIVYWNNIPQDSATFSCVYIHCNSLSVFIYHDFNENCIKDTGEYFNYVPANIEVDSNSILIGIYSVTGGLNYAAYGPPGTIYTFTFISPSLFSLCPSSGIISDTIPSIGSYTPVKYFGLKCPTTGSAYDLSINKTILGTGVHSQAGHIYVLNHYCDTTLATVTLNYSPKFSSSFTSPTPASHIGNTITWNLALSASTIPTMLTYHLETSPAPYLPIGDTVQSYFSITPISFDIIPGNNTCISVDTVRSGYDPNFIDVTPSGCFLTDTQLQYTINFENTGNDTAHNIHVLDTLSANVDMNSLKIILTSAEMNISQYTAGPYNIVKFDFPHINLLDSSHHDLCDGAVIFTVNTLPGLADGSTIFNRAGIYFDDNDVVMTNTVENMKGCFPDAVSIVKQTNKVDIYPNPATDELTIKMDAGAYNSCTITNNVGQVLITQPLDKTTTKVNIKTLPAGLYYITVKGDNGSKVQKFVKM